MEMMQKICLVITIIGAINWGLIGVLDFNLVETIFGTATFITRVIYSLVGITGIINIGLLMAQINFKRD
jgi:hypothetical protein